MSDGIFTPLPEIPPPPAPPPSPPRSRRRLMLFLGGVFLIFVIFIIVLLGFAVSFQTDDDLTLDFGGDKVALVEITGEILEARQTVDLIRKYTKDGSIRAIVLRIDSPGGGVAASQEIHEEVKRIRAGKQKPVVVSMSSVAASGGYYIACAADKIVANAGSITGSIGVIASWTNFQELFGWAKLKNVTIKSGPYKDSGSPLRDLTPDERQYFQSLVDELYEQFVASVAEGRKMKVEAVRQLADGRVFTGAQAKKLGLIDEIGNLQDAVQLAAKLAGIEGEPRLVEPKKEKVTLFDLLFGSVEKYLPALRSGTPAPVFEYRWAPSMPDLVENK